VAMPNQQRGQTCRGFTRGRTITRLLKENTRIISFDSMEEFGWNSFTGNGLKNGAFCCLESAQRKPNSPPAKMEPL
jgi:hypothetical protein